MSGIRHNRPYLGHKAAPSSNRKKDRERRKKLLTAAKKSSSGKNNNQRAVAKKPSSRKDNNQRTQASDLSRNRQAVKLDLATKFYIQDHNEALAQAQRMTRSHSALLKEEKKLSDHEHRILITHLDMISDASHCDTIPARNFDALLKRFSFPSEGIGPELAKIKLISQTAEKIKEFYDYCQKENSNFNFDSDDIEQVERANQKLQAKVEEKIRKLIGVFINDETKVDEHVKFIQQQQISSINSSRELLQLNKKLEASKKHISSFVDQLVREARGDEKVLELADYLNAVVLNQDNKTGYVIARNWLFTLMNKKEYSDYIDDLQKIFNLIETEEDKHLISGTILDFIQSKKISPRSSLYETLENAHQNIMADYLPGKAVNDLLAAEELIKETQIIQSRYPELLPNIESAKKLHDDYRYYNEELVFSNAAVRNYLYNEIIEPELAKKGVKMIFHANSQTSSYSLLALKHQDRVDIPGGIKQELRYLLPITSRPAENLSSHATRIYSVLPDFNLHFSIDAVKRKKSYNAFSLPQDTRESFYDDTFSITRFLKAKILADKGTEIQALTRSLENQAIREEAYAVNSKAYMDAKAYKQCEEDDSLEYLYAAKVSLIDFELQELIASETGSLAIQLYKDIQKCSSTDEVANASLKAIVQEKIISAEALLRNFLDKENDSASTLVRILEAVVFPQALEGDLNSNPLCETADQVLATEFLTKIVLGDEVAKQVNWLDLAYEDLRYRGEPQNLEQSFNNDWSIIKNHVKDGVDTDQDPSGLWYLRAQWYKFFDEKVNSFEKFSQYFDSQDFKTKFETELDKEFMPYAKRQELSPGWQDYYRENLAL